VAHGAGRGGAELLREARDPTVVPLLSDAVDESLSRSSQAACRDVQERRRFSDRVVVRLIGPEATAYQPVVRVAHVPANLQIRAVSRG
jgi:hypothetical protein